MCGPYFGPILSPILGATLGPILLLGLLAGVEVPCLGDHELQASKIRPRPQAVARSGSPSDRQAVPPVPAAGSPSLRIISLVSLISLGT